jgi:menaquinol-cytochrome c reductase iron-sulfur subunit
MIAASSPQPPDRRSFFKQIAALVVGGIAAVVPMLAGILTLLDPLRRKAGAAGFLQVAALSSLPEDGSPRRFAVVADRSDAWNKFPQEPIGAVYLRRTGRLVQALSATCPHAGCPVGYAPGGNTFLCPCHDSRFELDGSLADSKSPSARAMDALEVELRNETEIWVKFQNFEAGKAKKIPQA